MRLLNALPLLLLPFGAGCSDWEDPGTVPGTSGGGPQGGDAASASGGTTGGSVNTSGGSPSCARTAMPVSAHPTGLRAVGGRIEDADGNPVVLRGVNRSGSEYACIEDRGLFDGPSDEASVRAIAAFNVNAVRVPLNESCWLAINGAPARFSGARYQQAIVDYVALLHKYGLVPILDLHWAAPADLPAGRLLPMPNQDHSLDFWREVATTFKDDTGVVFEPYNEPFPDSNRDTPAGWACWRDGCTVPASRGQSWPEYTAVGMQQIVDVIREVGAEHLILLGGLQYSNALSRWLEHMPLDPLENLGAAWHVYNFNACRNATCWDNAPSAVAEVVPVVATEIGEDTCAGNFINPLMEFLDTKGSGYLAWSWNAYGACIAQEQIDGMNHPGQPWPLITNYTCPEPNSDYARAFFDHLATHAR